MVPKNLTRTRNIAASLLTISGISHIAELWFRDINSAALAGAMFGALYLIIGIGLYGQSRFSLFMAIIVPATGLWLALQKNTIGAMPPLALIQTCIAGAVIVGSSAVLYAVRNNASV
jgi:hypothetical protein